MFPLELDCSSEPDHFAFKTKFYKLLTILVLFYSQQTCLLKKGLFGVDKALENQI